MKYASVLTVVFVSAICFGVEQEGRISVMPPYKDEHVFITFNGGDSGIGTLQYLWIGKKDSFTISHLSCYVYSGKEQVLWWIVRIPEPTQQGVYEMQISKPGKGHSVELRSYLKIDGKLVPYDVTINGDPVDK